MKARKQFMNDLNTIDDLHRKAQVLVGKHNSILSVLNLKLCFDFGVKVVENYGKYGYFCSINNEAIFGKDERVQKIIDLIIEIDYPVIKSQVLPILQMLNFSAENIEVVLENCASNEQYDEYLNYERG